MKYICCKCGTLVEKNLWKELEKYPLLYEIAELLVEGCTTPEMVKRLNLPLRTIKARLGRLYHLADIDRKTHSGRVKTAILLWEEWHVRQPNPDTIREVDCMLGNGRVEKQRDSGEAWVKGTVHEAKIEKSL